MGGVFKRRGSGPEELLEQAQQHMGRGRRERSSSACRKPSSSTPISCPRLNGLLLDRGASLTEPIAGFPPLSFCVSVWTQSDTDQDTARTAAFLVSRGADVNGVNDLGATPLDDSLISEKRYLAEALQSLGCRSGML